MVYIRSWSEYQTKAEKLYEEQPTLTRYCVKYRAVDGILILKVTDDKTCLKYKTRSSIMLNRFEAFNLGMMSKMQNRQPSQAPTYSASSAAVPSSATIKDVPMAEAVPASQSTSGNAPTTPNPGGTSGNAAAKKKKPKKKK